VLDKADVSFQDEVVRMVCTARTHRRRQSVGSNQASRRGLIDADLGGGLIKQRVAGPGKGRSGGHRVIVAYRARKRAVFLLGFSKSEQENIGPDELRSLRKFGENVLAASSETVDASLENGSLKEVEYGKEE
jgi:hypothetical protein